MARMSKMFAVKAVTAKGDKRFYNDVGRAFVNDGDKGPLIKIVLSMFPDLELVAFPVEPKGDTAAGE